MDSPRTPSSASSSSYKKETGRPPIDGTNPLSQSRLDTVSHVTQETVSSQKAEAAPKKNAFRKLFPEKVSLSQPIGIKIKIPESSKRNSLEDKELFSPPPSHKRIKQVLALSPQSLIDASQPPNVSFSPRVCPEQIQEMFLILKDQLEPSYPLCLSRILAQIAYNQYACVSQGGAELAIALEQSDLLVPFILAIEKLSTPDSALFRDVHLYKVRLRRLIETALKILRYPQIAPLLKRLDVEEAIQRIISRGSEHFKSPKLSTLATDAKDAVEFYKEQKITSLNKIAEKGIELLFESVQTVEEQKVIKDIQYQYENRLHGQERIFLFATHQLLCERKETVRLGPLQREALLQQAALLILHPEFVFLATIIKIKKIALELLVVQETDSLRTQHLKCTAERLLTIKSISLKEMQFLLFWIQNSSPIERESLELIAGTREWDPEGRLYHVAVSRFIELSETQNPDLELLAKWLQFIHFWRQAPANQDLVDKPEWTIAWQKIDSALRKLPDLKKLLGQKFLTKLCHLEMLSKNHSLPKLHGNNPLFRSSSPALQIKENLWEREFILEDLLSSVLFHLLSNFQEISVLTLTTPVKGAPEVIVQQGKHFNQITQFFVEELLSCRSGREMRRKVKVLCLLQRKLLDSFAFEAAGAIHAVFQQVPISRLSLIFRKVDGFKELFDNPHAICERKLNAQELRKFQSEHQESFIQIQLLWKDLIHIRESFCEFTMEGNVDFDYLKKVGSLFNQFSISQSRAISFWTFEQKINPDKFLIESFSHLSGDITDDELQANWWQQSWVFRPEGSDRPADSFLS